jgi:hypothetical protein
VRRCHELLATAGKVFGALVIVERGRQGWTVGGGWLPSELSDGVSTVAVRRKGNEDSWKWTWRDVMMRPVSGFKQ